MSNLITTGDVVQYLKRLRQSIAQRRQLEVQWEALGAGIKGVELDEIARELDSLLEPKREQAEKEYQSVVETLCTGYESQSTAAAREFEVLATSISQQAAGEFERAEAKFRQEQWLNSMMWGPDVEGSPQFEFRKRETLLTEQRVRLEGEVEKITQLSTRATEIMQTRRQGVVEIEFEPTPPETTEKCEEKINQGILNSTEEIEALERHALSKLFIGFRPLLWTVLPALIVTPLVLVLLDPGIFREGSSLINRGLLVGGVLQFVGLAAFLMAQVVSRSFTSQRFANISETLRESEVCLQQWSSLTSARLDQQREEAAKSQRERTKRLQEKSDQLFRESQAQRAQTERWCHEQLARAKNDFQAQVILLTEARDRKLRAAEEKFRQQMERIEEARTKGIQERKQAREQLRANSLRERDRIWDVLANQWMTDWDRLLSDARDYGERAEQVAPDWEHCLEEHWELPNALPEGLLLGSYQGGLGEFEHGISKIPELVPDQSEFNLPFLLPFPGTPSLLIEAPTEQRIKTDQVLQSIVLRWLTMLPAGKIRLTLIDPVGLGENLSSFMHMADYDELLVNGKIWSEPSKIEAKLQELTEHLEHVFQTYLRYEYATIEEYNLSAGEVAEPYRLLVIAGFPANFTEAAARRLTNIINTGRRCGVVTMMCLDPKSKMPFGFDLSEVSKQMRVIRWRSAGGWTDSTVPDLRLEMNPSPLPEDIAQIVRKVGAASKDARRVEVPFDRIALKQEQWWSRDSRGGLEIPLGRAGATALQTLKLGRGTSQHVLIAGRTGSGKSSFLHVLITNLALHYSPEEVEFYLIDFKKGVEFKTYAVHALPHARVIAIESDREFGLSVLARLDEVLQERGELFREQEVQDVASYRALPGSKPLSRIVLLIDEFQELFVEDDRTSQAASLLLDRLVRQGRAFGIHLVLGSQTLGGNYTLPRSTIGQMGVRIALQCSETDSHLILSEQNMAARNLTRPGEAIYNDANGLLEGNHPFQIAWLPDHEREVYLDNLLVLAKERHIESSPPVVFEGQAAGDGSKCRPLDEAIAAKSPAVPITPLSGWPGDPIAIRSPSAVELRQMAGDNLLIVGQDRELAAGMTAHLLTAWAAQIPILPREERAHAQFNLFIPGAGVESLRWKALVQAFPHDTRILTSKSVDEAIASIAAEMVRRIDSDEPFQVQPLFLVVHSLGEFRQLRRKEDDYGYLSSDAPPSPSQQFAQILRDGPSVGIYTIIWAEVASLAGKWFNSSTLREFGWRIAMQLNANDSTQLIDSPLASQLGSRRALLCHMETGAQEKIRPYAWPSDSWFIELGKRLRNGRTNPINARPVVPE